MGQGVWSGRREGGCSDTELEAQPGSGSFRASRGLGEDLRFYSQGGRKPKEGLEQGCEINWLVFWSNCVCGVSCQISFKGCHNGLLLEARQCGVSWGDGLFAEGGQDSSLPSIK